MVRGRPGGERVALDEDRLWAGNHADRRAESNVLAFEAEGGASYALVIDRA